MMMGERSKKLRRDRLRKLADGPYTALTIRYGRRYLKDYPEDGLVWYLLANTLIEMARYEEAEQANAKAIEYCPLKKTTIRERARNPRIFDVNSDWS
jgi:tetratricopeptide (TPR) repeat protein